MEIQIDYNKSAQENAEEYFERSKKAKRKSEGAEKAIKELEQRRSKVASTEPESKAIRNIGERRWYEKFNWFFTSSGMLCIGGRSAQQNELVYSKHFENGDLFFHADIFGASVVILKGGEGAQPEQKAEAAQFAAIFSSAWEERLSATNVYALKKGQVSKSKEKGSLGTGSFLLEGEREWFKGNSLELAVPVGDGNPEIRFLPMLACKQLNIARYLLLKPGNKKKSDAAKEIAKKLSYTDIDYIMQHLPAGSFSVKEIA